MRKSIVHNNPLSMENRTDPLRVIGRNKISDVNGQAGRPH